MENNFSSLNSNVRELSSLKLAFIGDVVFELIVRETLVNQHPNNINELNKLKNKLVCCQAQSSLYGKIENILTEEELTIYKRARNAHVNRKNIKASPTQYHRATGIEALFGFLYLTGNMERLKDISKMIDFN